MTALRELTSDEIACLSAVLAKLRPHGAKRWDAAGIRATLAKVAQLDAANVLMAAIRLSQDRSAETPAQIAIPSSQCWVERVSDWQPPTKPYDHGTACGICDQPEDRCRANQWSGHEYQPKPAALAARVPGHMSDRLAKAQHTQEEQ